MAPVIVIASKLTAANTIEMAGVLLLSTLGIVRVSTSNKVTLSLIGRRGVGITSSRSQ